MEKVQKLEVGKKYFVIASFDYDIYLRIDDRYAYFDNYKFLEYKYTNTGGSTFYEENTVMLTEIENPTVFETEIEAKKYCDISKKNIIKRIKELNLSRVE